MVSSEQQNREPAVADEEGAGAKKQGPLKRLFLWVLSWAESRHSGKAMATLAYTEAIFFPVPADILLIVLCLGKPKRSLRFAAITVIFSILGGLTAMMLGLLIGKENIIAAMQTVNLGAKADLALGLLNEHGFWAVAIAALTPVPYLAFSWLAGFAEISVATFIAASLVFRSIRFFSEGVLIYFLGERAERLIERYFNLATVIVMVLIIAIFFTLRALGHLFGL
ncbi:MAG: hypothetical protein QGD94_12025 [Planctomycetia bacterium]|nr:hypothetical protein [Planctomycetia bacterium]